VEETELLDLFSRPCHQVIGLYLESFVQGRVFDPAASSANPSFCQGGRTASELNLCPSRLLAGNDELIRGFSGREFIGQKTSSGIR
jgi:hypothetical protein